MKGETTIRSWDAMTITVKVSRLATWRMRVGVWFIKLGARVIGCGFHVIDEKEAA